MKAATAPVKAVALAADTVRLSNLTDLFTRAFHQERNLPEGIGFYAGEQFLQVRTLGEDDSSLLRRFLQDGLSEESRRTRFLTSMPRISASAAEYLAQRDGRDRVALIAVNSTDETETIVGMAEYANVSTSPDSPEVAIAVADAFQGKGVARQLVAMLATLSIAAGYTTWSADYLSDNEAIVRTLETVGDIRILSDYTGVRHVEIDIQPSKLLP